MGNIIGENFPKKIASQVTARQKIYGSKNRTNDQLRYINANSAWVKLSSSVNVDATIAAKLGTNDVASDLAKNWVLFGGSALNSGSTLRKGISESYIQGNQGYRPMPGIISMESKNRNRGSLRETTLRIKCFDTHQFNIIDALYLRLGYTVLIEWGHSLWIDNNGNLQETNQSDTLTSSFLSTKYENKQNELQKDIEKKKLESYGNYDATFGKVVNFDWTYGKDGSYEITLKIVSLGDVVESLKVNTLAKGQVASTPEESQSNEDELESEEDELDILNLSQDKNSINKVLYEAAASCGQFSDTFSEYETIDDAKAKELGFTGADDFVGIEEESNTWDNDEKYFVRLGGFLHYLNNNRLIYNKNGKPLFVIDNDEDTNLIFTTPDVLSSDPRICVVKTTIPMETEDYQIFPGLPKEFKETKNGVMIGKLMNVYLNLVFVTKALEETKDENGNTSLFDLLKKICEGINSSLGNINKLEPVIDEMDNNRLYFIDETTIPGINKIYPDLDSNPVKFELYGFKEGQASFIEDFGIKTEITNELSSMITIGAQANGSAQNMDATAFSQWNKGYTDRIIPEKLETKSSEDIAQEAVTAIQNAEAEQKNIDNVVQAYSKFVEKIQELKWMEDVDTFPEILSNYLNHKQSTYSKSVNKASTTLGFIPLNLNLTFRGLSGFKIYQKFSINPYFLPPNYGDKLTFLVKSINHKVEGNSWTTSIESLSVPSDNVAASFNPSKTAFVGSPIDLSENGSYSSGGSNPVTPTAGTTGKIGLSGISSGKCGTKYIASNDQLPPLDNPMSNERKQALQNAYNATFANGQYKSGLCAKYTYNHAYNYVQSLFGGKVRKGASLAAGANANQSGYWANLVKLGYSQTVVAKNITKAELQSLISSKLQYNLGDVVVYWENTHPNDKSAGQYGHTQMYIGKGNIKEKSDAPKAPSGWITDRFTNYGTAFVYGGKTGYECWNLILFRAPLPGSNGGEEGVTESDRKLYEKYVKGLKLILEGKDSVFNNSPILSEFKGTLNDDEEGAVQRLNAIFGYSTQKSNGKAASWNNYYDFKKLPKDYQGLFTIEFRRMLEILRTSKGVMNFKYPDKNNSKAFSENSYLQLNTDF